MFCVLCIGMSSVLNKIIKDFEKYIAPFYERHEYSFDLESFHGRFHILRCLILSHYLIDFYKKGGVEIEEEVVYYSVMFHDIAREGNGIDIWEKESADRCLKFLIQKKLWKESFAKETSELILKKEPFSLEGQILYDVDVLDYNRFLTFLEEDGMFDESRLICFGEQDKFLQNSVIRRRCILMSKYLVKESMKIPVETNTKDLIIRLLEIYFDFSKV